MAFVSRHKKTEKQRTNRVKFVKKRFISDVLRKNTDFAYLFGTRGYVYFKILCNSKTGK